MCDANWFEQSTRELKEGESIAFKKDAMFVYMGVSVCEEHMREIGEKQAQAAKALIARPEMGNVRIN